MIKKFDEYIKEQFGAITMQQKNVNQLFEPDSKAMSPLIMYPSGSQGIPKQWINSPFLAGSPYTSAFGMNPSAKDKKSKRAKILSYFDFMETSKKLNSKK